jgi:serine/threonine protein kinase
MSDELQYTAFQSRYRDKQYIGAGGFGKVYKVFDHAKNHYVALKVSDVRPEYSKFTLKNEVELVNKLNHHRNIARYDACYRFNTGITGEMDFALLKFYEDGNLEQFLKKTDLSNEDKRLIIGGILNGLSFLHDNHIIHRDLKAENILMSREDGVWTPKITDFGLSREVSNSTNITNSAVGISYAYAAPEQILNQKIYRNVDIWAMGVIIYRIIANELPFGNKENADKKSVNTQLEISKKITSNELPEKLDSLDEPFRSMIKRCLVRDPLERAQKPSELITLLKGGVEVKDFLGSESFKEDAESPTQNPDEEATVFNPRKSEIDDNEGKNYENTLPPADYEVPNQNQTQFIPHSKRENESKDTEEEQVIEKKIKTGDPKSSISTPLIFMVALFLLAGGIGAWWILNDRSGSTQSDMSEREIAFIPQDGGEAMPEFSDDRYEDLEEVIKANAAEITELMRIEEELKALAVEPSNAKNYRPYFLLALNQAFQNQSPRAVFESIAKSASIALVNDVSQRLLSDLTQEKEGAFERFSKLRKWENITAQLEQFK